MSDIFKVLETGRYVLEYMPNQAETRWQLFNNIDKLETTSSSDAYTDGLGDSVHYNQSASVNAFFSKNTPEFIKGEKDNNRVLYDGTDNIVVYDSLDKLEGDANYKLNKSKNITAYHWLQSHSDGKSVFHSSDCRVFAEVQVKKRQGSNWSDAGSAAFIPLFVLKGTRLENVSIENDKVSWRFSAEDITQSIDVGQLIKYAEFHGL